MLLAAATVAIAIYGLVERDIPGVVRTTLWVFLPPFVLVILRAEIPRLLVYHAADAEGVRGRDELGGYALEWKDVRAFGTFFNDTTTDFFLATDERTIELRDQATFDLALRHVPQDAVICIHRDLRG